MRDPDRDALDAYEEAEERRQAIIQAWEEEGRPLTSVGHAGQPVARPLVMMINEAEVITDRLREHVRTRGWAARPRPSSAPTEKRITRLKAVPAPKPKAKKGTGAERERLRQMINAAVRVRENARARKPAAGAPTTARGGSDALGLGSGKTRIARSSTARESFRPEKRSVARKATARSR